eukprot:SAG31_NODE_12495_length_937_cov_1.325776_1_plen_47_part_00
MCTWYWVVLNLVTYVVQLCHMCVHKYDTFLKNMLARGAERVRARDA